MNTSHLRIAFLERLFTHLQKEGMKFVKSQISYKKTTSWGEQRFFMSFTKWTNDDGFYIDLGFQIRFDAIEQLYNETSVYGKKNQNTSTIGMGLDNCLNNGNAIYQRYVENEIDAIQAADYYYCLYKEIVIPLFSKYDTLEAINHLLNSEPTKEIKLLNVIFRGIKGVIVAYLLKVSDAELNKLIETYSQQYVTMADGFYKPDFDKVVENIRQHKSRDN